MNRVVFGRDLYIKGRIGWQLLRKDEYLTSGDYYLITGVDIMGNHKIDFDKCYYVTKERYEKDENIQLKENDIILTKDGTIGKIGYIDKLDKPATLNSHLFVLRNQNKEILDDKYLYYILCSDYFKKYSLSRTSGSNIPAFTQGKISEFEIDVPDLNIQKKVSNFLSIIDEKINNNLDIINNIEKLSKLYYEYWFLQFDFPDKNGKPYKSSGGNMEWNDDIKMNIPLGWKVLSVRDVLEVKTGKQDANFATLNGKYKYFTCSSSDYLCDESAFEGKSVLIAGNGDFNVKYYDGKFNAYQRTYVLTPKEEKYIGCIYESSIRLIEYFKSGSNGSIVKFITKSDIENIKIIIPDNEELLKYLNINLDYIQSLKLENDDLERFKEKIMPLLMNGQVIINE